MIFEAQDIQDNCKATYRNLPSAFSRSTDQYIIVKYRTNYSDGSVVVDEIKESKTISLGIYKGVVEPNSVAYFTSPFDSKNFLLYQILIALSGDSAKEVRDMYEKFRLRDIEEARVEIGGLVKRYDEIYSSTDFRKSISKYIVGNKKQLIVDELCALADIVQSYYEKKGESLFCEKLNKVIGAIHDANGNLIADDVKGVVKYMMVGQLSELSAIDGSLREAKNLLRANASVSSIYDTTGWFYNRNDSKWRKEIDDSDSVIAENALIMDRSQGDDALVYFKDGSYGGVAPSIVEKIILYADCNLGSEFLDKLPYLPQVLVHPSLYKEYPNLAYVKCFYGALSIGDKRYKHFFSAQDNMIVSFCNPSAWHKHTVMLHEIQHAIQERENWARGGNPSLAMLGMENSQSLRDFMNSVAAVEHIFSTLQESQLQFIRAILLLPNNTDYKNVSVSFFNSIISKQIELSDFQNTFNVTEYEAIYNNAESAHKIMMMGDAYANVLKARGYSGSRGSRGWDGEIGLMVFKAYEMLLGEVEARYTQKSGLSKGRKNYFLPLSAETYNQQDLIIYNDDYSIKVAEKKNFLAAIEWVDGKFTIHLKVTQNAEPIAHELGHILYGEFANFPDLMNGCYKAWVESGVSDFEEHFVSCYLNYLKRKANLPTLASEITSTDSSVFVDKFLDHIFFGVEAGVFDYETAERHLQFIKLVLQD